VSDLRAGDRVGRSSAHRRGAAPDGPHVRAASRRRANETARRGRRSPARNGFARASPGGRCAAYVSIHVALRWWRPVEVTLVGTGPKPANVRVR